MLLEKHYREFHHQYTLEICRGYGSLDSELMSARIELEEEISLTLSYKNKLQLLGEIYPDSGINNNVVSIFSLELKGKFTPHANDAEEQIDGFELKWQGSKGRRPLVRHRTGQFCGRAVK